MEEKSCKVRSICHVLHRELTGQSRGMPARCQGWAATQGGPQGPWQCPCPSRWDLSNLHLAVMEPNWMLDSWSRPLLAHISFPLLPDLGRRQHLSLLSLPTAAEGEAGPSPRRGGHRCPPPPPSLGMAGGPRAAGRTERDACEALGSLCSAARALPLHPTSLELELGVVPTLAGCSASTSRIFLISPGCLVFPLLAFTPLPGLEGPASRRRPMGASLCRAKSWLLVTTSFCF